MTVAIVILSLLCAILIALLCVAGFYLIRFGRALLAYTDAVEKCLDVLNISYVEIYGVLQTPVGSDDPMIRAIVDSIKRAHDSILVVAQSLSRAWNESITANDKAEDDAV